MLKFLFDKVEVGEDVGMGEFLLEWVKMVDILCELVVEDEVDGYLFFVVDKLCCVLLYLFIVECMQGYGYFG